MQVDLSELSMMFNHYIVNLEQKLAKNKQRVAEAAVNGIN